MHHPHDIHDVIIAGAGPVGLFLACELRLHGVSVLMLEQAADAVAPLKRLPFGMRGLSAATLDAFDRRGLLAPLADAQRTNAVAGGMRSAAHWTLAPRQPAGHFAGLPFFHDAVDPARWSYRLPTPGGTGMTVEMASLEAVLAARAGSLGVEVRRGFGVAQVEAGDDGVTVQAGGATFRGRWLIGCDGGRSTVRKAGSFGFTGTDPEITGYSVAAEVAEPNPLQPGRTHTATGMYTFAPPGTIAIADYDGGACHRAGPITRAHVQAVLRRVSGTDVTLSSLRLASTWTDRAFQATRMRQGRVLLAGDAAHTHSPLGGQGLNLGLGDALNLGWKLAATIGGTAPETLLDTYHDERHPVAAQVLDWSRAQIALMRPTPGTRALQAVIRDLLDTRDGATAMAERVWGVGLRYDGVGDHPLAGRSVPAFTLADGRRVGDLLRDGRGLLLDFDARASLREAAGRWRGRFRYLGCDATERLGLGAALVRPDGVVAWASEVAAPDHQFTRAASRWFGEPGGVHASA